MIDIGNSSGAVFCILCNNYIPEIIGDTIEDSHSLCEKCNNNIELQDLYTQEKTNIKKK